MRVIEAATRRLNLRGTHHNAAGSSNGPAALALTSRPATRTRAARRRRYLVTCDFWRCIHSSGVGSNWSRFRTP